MAREPHDMLELAMHGLLQRRRGGAEGSSDSSRVCASLSESLVLRYLTDGFRTQQELGAFLGLDKSTVSRLVGGLVGKGWVHRERHPQLRRCYQVLLTPAGRDAADCLAKATSAHHARWLAGLTPAELEALTTGVTALIREMSIPAVPSAATPD